MANPKITITLGVDKSELDRALADAKRQIEEFRASAFSSAPGGAPSIGSAPGMGVGGYGSAPNVSLPVNNIGGFGGGAGAALAGAMVGTMIGAGIGSHSSPTVQTALSLMSDSGGMNGGYALPGGGSVWSPTGPIWTQDNPSPGMMPISRQRGVIRPIDRNNLPIGDPAIAAYLNDVDPVGAEAYDRASAYDNTPPIAGSGAGGAGVPPVIPPAGRGRFGQAWDNFRNRVNYTGVGTMKGALTSPIVLGAAGLATAGVGLGNSIMDSQESGSRLETHDWILGALGELPIIGGMFHSLNRSIDNAYDEKQMAALAPLASTSRTDLTSLVDSGAGLGVPHLQAASQLGMKLGSGMGRSGAGVALDVAAKLYAADPTLDKSLATAQINALSGATNAETAAALGKPGYDRGIAASLATRDPLAAAAYIQLKGGKDTAQDIFKLSGDLETQGFVTQGLMSKAEAAGSNTAAVTARGGNAAAIGGAIGGEITALQNAAQGIRDLISAAERLGATAKQNGADLEGFRAQLASTTATIAEREYAQRRVYSDTALDVAGTRTAVASSALGPRLSTARVGDRGVYSDVISSLTSERDTISNELNRFAPGTPDHRRLERQLGAQDAAIWSARRQESDYYIGQPGRIVGNRLTEARAGEDVADSVGSAAEIRYARSRVAMRSSQFYGTEQAKLARMQADPFTYGDEDISNQSAAVASARAASVNAFVQATRAPLSSMDIANLGGQDLNVQRALRQGGANAIGATTGLISSWSGIRSDRDRAYRNNPNGATLGDLTQADRNLLTLQEGLGGGGLDATIGTTLDSAISKQHILETNMFAGLGVDRRVAAMDTMAATRSALSDAQTRLKAAVDPQTRRSISSEINQYNESLSSQELNINDGFFGRLADRTIGAPNRSAFTNVSYRDVLMFDPNGNRHVGSRVRDGYETDRHDTSAGRTNKPGSVQNQVTVLIDVSPQAKQMGFTARQTGGVGGLTAGKRAG